MRAVWIASIVGALWCAPTDAFRSASAADRVILRDLTILADHAVTSFDEDGVRLDDDTRLTWDRIERGTVAPDRQAAFDRLREEIGRPLFQLRVRLRVGDDAGLAEPAERLAPRFADRDGPSAYLVQRALMRARLAAGRREAAVEPYLRALRYVWRAEDGRENELPIEQRMRIDRETGLSPELAPVWFDAQAARDALAGVRQAAAGFPEPRPDALRIYFGALAATAGDLEAAERAISGIGQHLTETDAVRRATDWRDVLRLGADAKAPSAGPAADLLAGRAASLAPVCRPVAYYWIGVAKTANADAESRLDGILSLLRVPASYGVEQPELAAASLVAAAATLESLGDANGAAALRRERATRYARVSDERLGGAPSPPPAVPPAATAPATPEPASKTPEPAPKTSDPESTKQP